MSNYAFLYALTKDLIVLVYEKTISSVKTVFANTSGSKDCISELKNKEEEILGIAKTKGTEGQTVKVYVPKLAEYISTEEGNRIISEEGEEIRNE